MTAGLAAGNGGSDVPAVLWRVTLDGSGDDVPSRVERFSGSGRAPL